MTQEEEERNRLDYSPPLTLSSLPLLLLVLMLRPVVAVMVAHSSTTTPLARQINLSPGY